MKNTIYIYADKIDDGYKISASNGDVMPSNIYKSVRACNKAIQALYASECWGLKKVGRIFQINI